MDAIMNMPARAIRIAKLDARLTAIDLVYGLVYVAAGFCLPYAGYAPERIVVVPFILLMFVLVYFVFRICGPEAEPETAMFYANLPRGRGLAFWIHAAWLGLYAFVMELGIVLYVALRNRATPTEHLYAPPVCFVLPFFVLIFIIWLSYARRNWLLDLFFIIPTALALIWLFSWDILQRGRLHGVQLTFAQNFGPALLLAGLTLALLLHASYRWNHLQIGELS